MTLVPPHDSYHLGTLHLGKRVLSFPVLDSTNTLALSLANDPLHDGLAVLAQEQTSGRGQYGRNWTAPPGSSVLLSMLLFPPLALRRPALLTAWAAVSVCETILEVVGLDARIKWPNDVLVEGHKVCGILIEQRNTGRADYPLATVAGIGLNVQQTADFFIESHLPLAASMTSLSGKILATSMVAERLIFQLDRAYHRLLQGDVHTLEELWQQRLGLIGKRVLLEMAEQRKEGRLQNITWDGVVLEMNQIVTIQPELVKHISEI